MLNDKNKNKNNKKIETTHVELWQPSLSLIHVTPAPPNPTRATTTIFFEKIIALETVSS